jgi:peroxidase
MNPLRRFARQLRKWINVRAVAKPNGKGKPQVELLEGREVPAVFGFRSFDGTGNNVSHTDWGSAGTDFIRLAAAQYTDGVSSPAGADRPSARLISNTLSDQTGVDLISDTGMSAMMYAWGQFIDHDLDLTNTQAGTSFPISVPTGDPYFDPNSTGTKTISMSRSVYDPATGTTTPRQQVNAITAWLDGSMVYGSDAATAASLRTFSGGQLKTSAGNLLPMDAQGNFLAGDIRVNENPELTSLHTLFMREHNRVAAQLARNNPRLSDEQLFQQAREWVVAEIQSITYNEWLPTLLGSNGIRPYQGYNPNVDPSISNEFSTAAFRLGHSMLGDDIEFLGNDGRPVREEVSLADAFFNPDLVKENGIDSMLKYLASDPSSQIDLKVVDSVRNFLFGAPGAGGLDLVSLNIQRGRDHGIANYNDTRAAVGLARVTSFSEITPDVEVQEKLRQLYGSVENIDLWVGGLAEAHTRGGNVGPTFKAIIADQFSRTRDADRFWYQRIFWGNQLRELERTSLTDIIKRNTSLTTVQDSAFEFKASISGTFFVDGNRDGKLNRGEPILANKQVELINTDTGESVAQTTTDARGKYSFDVEDGVRTGKYQVREVLASGSTATAVTSQIVSITGGDLFVRVDLAAVLPTSKVPQPPSTMSPPPRGGDKQVNIQTQQGHFSFSSNGSQIRISGASQTPAVFPDVDAPRPPRG